MIASPMPGDHAGHQRGDRLALQVAADTRASTVLSRFSRSSSYLSPGERAQLAARILGRSLSIQNAITSAKNTSKTTVAMPEPALENALGAPSSRARKASCETDAVMRVEGHARATRESRRR